MPQSLPPVPNGGPDMDLLRQLLMQDMGSRGVGQPQPGFVDRFLRPEGQARSPERFAGLLPSIGNEQLLSAMGQFQGGVNPEAHSALRSVVEQRSSDDIARGHGPAEPDVGLTSAEPTRSFNPFKILSDALSGQNREQ